MTARAVKLSQLSRLVMRPSKWDATAEAWSKTIPHDFPANYPEMLRGMVESGAANLAEIRTESGPVGILVWHIDGPEFVVVALAGRDGRDLTLTCAEHVEKYARRKGCKNIRFHTMRPGLVCKAEALGYRVSEIILRKDV